jgi:hypothetical protein
VIDRLHASWQGKGRLVRPFLFALLAASSGAGATPADRGGDPGRTTAAPSVRASEGRLRPPPLDCDRNHLTSWRGRVSGYRRDGKATWLQISTDDDTVEEATLAVPAPPVAPATYRLNGAAFTAQDWPRIETADGHSTAGLRATAWVCDDGVTPTVIDWQPPAAG